jgi:aryl-alcohol dehydrogenase-like predicted oxidoreductase
MQRRELGRTGQMVSSICLGTMTYGEQNTESEGHAQMDYALDRGINFFDTSEMYAIPPKPETQGSTERIIGTWFAARKNRDKVVLATKAAGRGPMTWLRDKTDMVDQSPAQLREALDKSLKRLQTDYIDLYQLHWPDRPTSLFGGGGLVYRDAGGEITPMLEILETLGTFVKEGKVRWIGVSNETAWGVMRFLHWAETKGLPRMQSIQNAYHLLNRTFEMGLAEVAHREGVGLLAYSPLAQGYLTGKYRNGALPPKARKTLFNRLQRYEKPEAEPAFERYFAIAGKFGIDPVKLAIKFCETRTFVTSTIIGATTMDQLKTDIDAIDLPWPEELENAVNAAHHAQPNPAP